MNKEGIHELNRIWSKIFLDDKNPSKHLTQAILSFIFQTKGIYLLLGIKTQKASNKIVKQYRVVNSRELDDKIEEKQQNIEESKVNSSDINCISVSIVSILQCIHQNLSDLCCIKQREKFMDYDKYHSLTSALENAIITCINDFSDFIDNNLDICNLLKEDLVETGFNFILEQIAEINTDNEINMFNQEVKQINITEISKMTKILVSLNCGYQEFYEFPSILELSINPKNDCDLITSIKTSMTNHLERKFDDLANLQIESLPQIMIFSIPNSCSLYKLYEQLLVTYSLDIYKSEFKNSEFHVKGEWKSNIGKDQPSYQFADFFNYLLNTALMPKLLVFEEYCRLDKLTRDPIEISSRKYIYSVPNSPLHTHVYGPEDYPNSEEENEYGGFLFSRPADLGNWSPKSFSLNQDFKKDHSSESNYYNEIMSSK